MTTQTPEKKENAWLNIILNVVVPAVIMTKFAGPDHLGETWSLVIALCFPLSYGIYDYITRRKLNFFSGLGLFSVLLTGGIGLFKLNRSWMVAKETGIPLLMGIVVLISERTKYPLVPLFFNQIMNLEKIQLAFAAKGETQRYTQIMNLAGRGLGGSFLLSALLNYILAVRILQGEPGTQEFTESLGRMTALSFPVITLPMMIVVGGIMVYLIKTIQTVTQMEFEDFLRQ
jgi:hypothetical protein